MDKILFILRGIPGSGKSTLAKSIGVDEIFEADQYFVNEKGEYNWTKEGLPLAQAWCTKSVMSAMEKGVPKIAVTNTFTKHWELNPYLEAARIHGYRIFCMVVENMHGKENHKIEILEFYDSRKELVQAEVNLITEEILRDPLCMNLSPGGLGGQHFFINGKPGISLINSKLNSERNKKRNQIHKNFLGKKHSEETKKKLSELAKAQQARIREKKSLESKTES